MPRKTKQITAATTISEAAMRRIKAAAHHYVLAGGGLVPGAVNGDDLTEYIAPIRKLLDRAGSEEDFERVYAQCVEVMRVADPDNKIEDIWSYVWCLVGDAADAGFVFGVFVGLEVAALGRGVETSKAVTQ